MYLRLSKSTLYQRKDIPRHRLPGSRQIRFIKSELLAWVTGEWAAQTGGEIEMEARQPHLTLATKTKPLYHRNARYR